MTKQHKLLLTVLVIGLGGALAGFGVFAAFSSTTSNPNNSFQAGNVSISDNDGGTGLFSNAGLHANTEPGDYDRCVRVTYNGTLDADVKLYSSAITGDGNGMNITVDKSDTGTATDCSDFGAGGTVESVYAAAPMTDFDDATDWATGIETDPIGATFWAPGEEQTFRFRITVGDNDQNATVDAFNVIWEAQNQ